MPKVVSVKTIDELQRLLSALQKAKKGEDSLKIAKEIEETIQQLVTAE